MADNDEPVFIVVMGVSGCGKSTLGRALAAALRVPFVDGDDLHAPASVAKMAAGHALADAERRPWLARIRRAAEHACAAQRSAGRRAGVVVACSALRRGYRALLRGEPVPADDPDAAPPAAAAAPAAPDAAPAPLRTCFVFIDGAPATLAARMQRRQGHFMKADMLAGQLAALEPPHGEPGVVAVDLGAGTAEQVRSACAGLGLQIQGEAGEAGAGDSDAGLGSAARETLANGVDVPEALPANDVHSQ